MDQFNVIVDRVNLPRLIAAGLFTVVLERDDRFTVHTVTSSQKIAEDVMARVGGESLRAFVMTRKKGSQRCDVVASSRTGCV